MAQNADTQKTAQQLLYPLDDPSTAFDNALRSSGLNPFQTNPFIAQLKKAAQGARVSFLANNFNQGPGGTDPSQNYGDWLKSQISGGNLMNSLSSTAQNYGNLIGQVNGYEKSLNNGGNASQLSPYAAALDQIFGSNSGQGSLSAYASLMSPQMGNGIGSAWTSGLQSMGASNAANFAQKAGPGDSVFNWLFGNSVTDPATYWASGGPTGPGNNFRF